MRATEPITLLEACKTGDRKAQYELYQQYSAAMFNICVRMMYDKTEAEDMLQEAFISAFQRIEQYTGAASFGAWLKRIVVNTCIDQLRKQRESFMSFEGVPESVIQEDAEEDMDLILKIDEVRQAIMDLPDGYRIVFSLYLLEGYDHGEIAQILGISESTSKTQYSRAKQKLRTMLKPKKNRRSTY
jgi:RNA polymerase sigma-70 factor (ECF subfamily)